MSFSFGDIVDAVSDAVPQDAPAFVHGGAGDLGWRDATKRMNNIARNLHARGARPGDKVAFYMRNGIEYGEITGACFLGRLTHVNVNYRYKPEEVRYIVDNSDATVVVYAREFRDAVAQIHNQLSHVSVFVEVSLSFDASRASPRMRSLRPPVPAPSSTSNARPTTKCSSTPAAPPACPRV